MAGKHRTPSAEGGVLDLIPILRFFARTLIRHPDESDDLVQETLRKALTEFSKFQSGGNLRVWLLAIMRNVFVIRAARHARRGQTPPLPPAPPIADTRPASARLLRAVARLPLRYREALVLVFFIGESPENTALICRSSPATVIRRLAQGFRMIRGDLRACAANDIFLAKT